ncbi:MYG1 exonuclease isoform X2 [Zonotrichia albicollis]|uniref:MYG1 exonuclease isoform X2 n=1 Tax=Zonotrichia albicollis TaxID=44394 RepID=UPI003D80D6A2
MRGAARAVRFVVMAATGTGTSAGIGTGHKRPHPEPAARIGTHDGTFHCDEALACFLLRLLPRYQDAEIVRTRDPQRLAGCDVVVDVGGEYDPGRHRYDHHQRSFTESMRSLRPDKPWSTKLSSAGLVYCHFGAQILAGLLGQPEDGPVVTALYDKLYENFVEEIDAMDNGIAPAAGEPRYALSTTLSARVGHLNPRWNDPDQDTEAGFRRAMELVGTEFLQRLDFYHRAWLPARALVEEAVRCRLESSCAGVPGVTGMEDKDSKHQDPQAGSGATGVSLKSLQDPTTVTEEQEGWKNLNSRDSMLGDSNTLPVCPSSSPQSCGDIWEAPDGTNSPRYSEKDKE